MIEFIVFCIPSVVYVIVQSRGQGQDVESTLQRVGATWGSPSGYRWALVLLLPILLTGWLASRNPAATAVATIAAPPSSGAAPTAMRPLPGSALSQRRCQPRKAGGRAVATAIAPLPAVTMPVTPSGPTDSSCSPNALQSSES